MVKSRIRPFTPINAIYRCISKKSQYFREKRYTYKFVGDLRPQFSEIVDFLSRFAQIDRMRAIAESIQENLESIVAYAYGGDSLLLKNTRERLFFEINGNIDSILLELDDR